MSVNAKYCRVTSADLDILKSDPLRVKVFFGQDVTNDVPFDEDFDWDVIVVNAKTVMDDPTRLLDLTNEWQAIHYMLTGEFAFQGKSKVEPPLCNVVMGGLNLVPST
jgi:hypothetical protein